jgi:hypothetical protein
LDRFLSNAGSARSRFMRSLAAAALAALNPVLTRRAAL